MSKWYLILTHSQQAYNSWCQNNPDNAANSFYLKKISDFVGLHPTAKRELEIVKVGLWTHNPLYNSDRLKLLEAEIEKFNKKRSQAQTCSNCAYLMQGYNDGDPDICNAFHSPSASVKNCPDWEKKKTFRLSDNVTEDLKRVNYLQQLTPVPREWVEVSPRSHSITQPSHNNHTKQ